MSLYSGTAYLRVGARDIVYYVHGFTKSHFRCRDPLSTPNSAGGPAPRGPGSNRLMASFQYVDFRVLWVATVVNQLGMGMQQVLLGWLVFDITESAGMVGVVLAARAAPNLLLGFAAGSITDRFDRRSLMRLTTWFTGAVSLAVAVLLYLDRLEVWHLITTTLLMGGLLSFYLTARQAYVYDVVGREGAINGIGLVYAASLVGGLFGALLGGAIIQWSGAGTTFAVMGAGYALSGVMLYGLRSPGEAAPQFPDPVWQNLVNYVRALRTNRAMVILIATTASAELFGFSHQVMLPVLAKEVLHVGAMGLGVITAFRFVAGTFGVLAVTALWRLPQRGILLVVALAGFGLGQVFLSLTTEFVVAVAFVALINMMASATDVLHHTLLQLSVPNDQRGRAMGSWIVGLGAAPIGSLQIGYVGELTSSRIALLVNGLAMAVVALGFGVLVPRLRRM